MHLVVPITIKFIGLLVTTTGLERSNPGEDFRSYYKIGVGTQPYRAIPNPMPARPPTRRARAS